MAIYELSAHSKYEGPNEVHSSSAEQTNVTHFGKPTARHTYFTRSRNTAMLLRTKLMHT